MYSNSFYHLTKQTVHTFQMWLCLVMLTLVPFTVSQQNGQGTTPLFKPRSIGNRFSETSTAFYQNNLLGKNGIMIMVKDRKPWKRVKLSEKRKNLKDHIKDSQENNNLQISPKYLSAEKKYFDYFPIEDVELNYDPHEDNIRVELISDNDIDRKDYTVNSNIPSFKKHGSYKRKKRDTLFHSIAKRSFMDSKQNKEKVTQRSTISRRRIVVDGLIESERGQNFPIVNCNYHSQGTSNDPWHNQFNMPISRFYLPVPHPVFVPVPVFSGYPFVYNPVQSLHGYLPPQVYLPPVKTPNLSTGSKNDNVGLGTRFGADDDRVIWDISKSSGRDQPTFERPTPEPESSQASIGLLPTTSTRKPPPPLIHRPDSGKNRHPTTATRPSEEGFRRQHFPSHSIIPVETSPKEYFSPTVPPSKCIWAVVTCCARNNLAIRYACFEQLGCHGAFWDLNPCTDGVQDAALEETSRFFDKN